jgi:hypothetical protein
MNCPTDGGRIKRSMMMDQPATVGKCRRLLAAVVALACGLVTTAAAEVHVEGNPSALRVTARGDMLSDVLSAFGRLFPVKYRTAVRLDAEISGTYSGSLSQVVSHLLDGYNYVIKNDQDLTEIIVFGSRGEAAVPPKVPTAKGALSRWQ